MINALCDAYLQIGAIGLITVVALWVLISQLKTQRKLAKEATDQTTKVNQSILDMFKGEIKDISLLTKQSIEIGCDNTRINKEIFSIIEKINANLAEHSKESNQNTIKLINSFSRLTDNLNGGNPTVVKLRKDFEEFKKKLDKSS